MRTAMTARLPFALMATLAIACGKKDAPDTEERQEIAPATSAPVPVDHLAPGELVEGKENAFGLPLPRLTRVRSAISGFVLADGDVSPEAVANYIRARVKEGTVTIGATETHFENVKVPSDPTRELSIRVGPGRGQRCVVQVRDVTPPVLPKMNSDAERWKAVGMTPDGKLLDPNNMQ